MLLHSASWVELQPHAVVQPSTNLDHPWPRTAAANCV